MPHELAEPPSDTSLRLADLDAADPNAALAFVNDVGLPLSEEAEVQPLSEFIASAAVVRSTVTAARLLQHEPSLTPAELAEAGFEPESAAEHLNLSLTVGLKRFHPMIWVVPADDALRSSAELGRLQDVSLFSYCCLELHNHVVTGAGYRRCANETCRRLFSSTEPGGANGARRAALYCSRACGRAQAQREYRRRRAAADA